MKRLRAACGLFGAAFLLAGSSALAQFSGFFGGYYAPANWTTVLASNATYQASARIDATGAAQSIEIIGAVDAMAQTQGPQPPASYIYYTVVLPNSGTQPIAFGYLFTGLADGYDGAQLISYNGNTPQVIANLVGQGTYSTTLPGGTRFGFRVSSNNDTVPDTLVISAVPEPSTLTLVGLGAAALLWRTRRRLS
jgi:hypothetical protein